MNDDEIFLLLTLVGKGANGPRNYGGQRNISVPAEKWISIF